MEARTPDTQRNGARRRRWRWLLGFATVGLAVTAEVGGGERGGTTLSVVSVSLADPRTHLIVWWGIDASAQKAPALKMQRVIERAGGRLGRRRHAHAQGG